MALFRKYYDIVIDLGPWGATPTAKEKADEIYKKYNDALFEGTIVKKIKIKKCALIAAETARDATTQNGQYYFYQRVIEEIEKL